MTVDDARLKRLKMRAWRRGFREADLILGPFVDKYGPEFSEADCDWLETLFEENDHDIYGWILERMPPPAEFDGPLMNRLKIFRDEAHKAIGSRGTANG